MDLRQILLNIYPSSSIIYHLSPITSSIPHLSLIYPSSPIIYHPSPTTSSPNNL
ncbi:hypothetical protein [Prevotella sp.]